MVTIGNAGSVEEQARRLDYNLRAAAELEHLLANAYLFAAFSLKKFPEEFAGHDKPAKREVIEAQLERNRRWQGAVLYVARQEMEHLCMVQNLLALSDRPAHLWRPSFPVDANEYPIDVPLTLQAFSRRAVEEFRYIEKPDTLELVNPFGASAELSARTGHPSIERLYEDIRSQFETLFDHRWISASNYNRVVNEHFGFNIELAPVIHGQVHQYVETIIGLIIAQGEGVGAVPPPLGSHFMTFQKILDDMASLPEDLLVESVLPVVTNPFVGSDTERTGTPVEHPYTQQAMALFDDGYQLMCRMLTGFFEIYDIDTTTGIHPPRPNAFFQTAFYPLMTMMMRPLGEILCRLPVTPAPARGPDGLPVETAGPAFGLRPADTVTAVEAWTELDPYMVALHDLSARAAGLAAVPPGVEPVGFEGARSLSHRMSYLSENLERMAVNFARYWNDEMVTVIPSSNFQNLPGIN